jgi:death-on-curing protein
MRRIELGDFLLIAEAHLGTSANRLARMPRTISLGEAALAAPFAGFGDFEAFPRIHEKAAVHCSRIVSYHPLPDGNKRVGYDVMREFLERNEVRFRHPPEGLDSTAQTIEDLAGGMLAEKDFIAWVRARLGGQD